MKFMLLYNNDRSTPRETYGSTLVIQLAFKRFLVLIGYEREILDALDVIAYRNVSFI